MENISDLSNYIRKNHVRLSRKNYNEIDALVFAGLAYFRFEDLYCDDLNRTVSVREFASDFLSWSEFESRYSKDELDFIKALSDSRRYVSCVIYDFKVEDITRAQWAAFTVDIDKSGTAVIAMRGTDGTVKGWSENLRLVYEIRGNTAQLASFRYLKHSKATNVFLTGHSKGGSNVVSAYVMSDAYTREKISRIDNFDGPGFNPEFAGHFFEGYAELRNKLNNFYPGDSVIGQLLVDNPGRTFFIQAKARGDYKAARILGQHDLFSFRIKGNEFEVTEQSCISKVLNRAVDNLVSVTNNQERNYLANIIGKMGIPTIIAGDAGNIACAVAKMVCGLIHATGEEWEVLFLAVATFIKTMIILIKEWIAQLSAKRYNVSYVTV